jgi:hypothetical protein
MATVFLSHCRRYLCVLDRSLFSAMTLLNKYFLRAFCPLLGGGRLLCQKMSGIIMETGGFCVCSAPIAGSMASGTTVNPVWLTTQSGQLQQSVPLSTELLVPFVVHENVKPRGPWVILIVKVHATCSAAVSHASTLRHPLYPSSVQLVVTWPMQTIDVCGLP